MAAFAEPRFDEPIAALIPPQCCAVDLGRLDTAERSGIHDAAFVITKCEAGRNTANKQGTPHEEFLSALSVAASSACECGKFPLSHYIYRGTSGWVDHSINPPRKHTGKRPAPPIGELGTREERVLLPLGSREERGLPPISELGSLESRAPPP